MASYYTNQYITPNAVIINEPIYSTPCRYYSTYTGCMYGNSCPFQHIDYTYSPQMNLLHDDDSSISLSSDQIDIIDTSDTINPKHENTKTIPQSLATTWNGCMKTIDFGSRFNMTIQKYNSKTKPISSKYKHNNLALLVSNCSDNKLNGLYLRLGYRNGYIKYTECINNISTIYCNPKRGWTISYNNAAYYYSYPLTDTPPTINNLNCNWLCNLESNKHLPHIKSKYIIGHCLLDLLFVGFVRNKNDSKCYWFMVSEDIIKLFYSYFIQYKNERCSNCLRQCENVILCGFKWVCEDCNVEMF